MKYTISKIIAALREYYGVDVEIEDIHRITITEQEWNHDSVFAFPLPEPDPWSGRRMYGTMEVTSLNLPAIKEPLDYRTRITWKLTSRTAKFLK